jgi:hypothetical protein
MTQPSPKTKRYFEALRFGPARCASNRFFLCDLQLAIARHPPPGRFGMARPRCGSAYSLRDNGEFHILSRVCFLSSAARGAFLSCGIAIEIVVVDRLVYRKGLQDDARRITDDAASDALAQSLKGPPYDQKWLTN